VVGHRQGRKLKLLGPFHEVRDFGGGVEEAVLRMAMEVNEFRVRHVSGRKFLVYYIRIFPGLAEGSCAILEKGAVEKIGAEQTGQSKGQGQRETHLEPAVQDERDEKCERQGDGDQDGKGEFIDFFRVAVFPVGPKKGEDRNQG